MSVTLHKCPVCDGTGLVSRPSHVAGDQQTWSDSNAGPYECSTCGGKGVLSTVNVNEFQTFPAPGRPL